MATLHLLRAAKAIMIALLAFHLLACSSESATNIEITDEQSPEQKLPEQTEEDNSVKVGPEEDQPIPIQVEIQWQPVTEYLIGSEIAEIDYYQIHLGTRVNYLDQVFVVEDPSQTSYLLKDLTKGDYYISMIAVAKNGERSDLSEPFTFSISQ